MHCGSGSIDAADAEAPRVDLMGTLTNLRDEATTMLGHGSTPEGVPGEPGERQIQDPVQTTTAPFVSSVHRSSISRESESDVSSRGSSGGSRGIGLSRGSEAKEGIFTPLSQSPRGSSSGADFQSWERAQPPQQGKGPIDPMDPMGGMGGMAGLGGLMTDRTEEPTDDEGLLDFLQVELDRRRHEETALSSELVELTNDRVGKLEEVGRSDREEIVALKDELRALRRQSGTNNMALDRLKQILVDKDREIDVVRHESAKERYDSNVRLTTLRQQEAEDKDTRADVVSSLQTEIRLRREELLELQANSEQDRRLAAELTNKYKAQVDNVQKLQRQVKWHKLHGGSTGGRGAMNMKEPSAAVEEMKTRSAGGRQGGKGGKGGKGRKGSLRSIKGLGGGGTGSATGGVLGGTLQGSRDSGGRSTTGGGGVGGGGGAEGYSHLREGRNTNAEQVQEDMRRTLEEVRLYMSLLQVSYQATTKRQNWLL